MLETINDIFNPAKIFEVLATIPGTGIEKPREVIDVECEIINDEIQHRDVSHSRK